jgi:2-phospho-L-lactate guanylyltransferase
MIHALIPVKPLHAAKTRLAAVLGAAERRELALAMLGDVLAAVHAAPAVAGVTVVSRDPAALALAAEYGARAMLDAAADLNGALEQGARHLSAAGVRALLVLPSDLPLLSAGDVELLARALGPGPAAALAPARDGGTNALLAAPPDALPFLFGRGSLAGHLAVARELGVAARLVCSPGLELDVDTPDDLLALAQAPGASAAQRLVRRLGLEAKAACA